MLRLAVALALLLALAGASRAAGVKEAGNWTAVCDNVGDCQVTGLGRGGGNPWPEGFTPYLILRRGGEPGAAIDLSFIAEPSAALGPPRPPPFRFAAGGRIIRSIRPEKPAFMLNFTQDDPGPDFSIRAFTGAELDAMLRALRRGRRLTVDQKGKPTLSVDLRGAAEVLAFVDAQQGRTGTVAALAAPGPAPEPTVTPPRRPRIELPPPADQAGIPFRPTLSAEVRDRGCRWVDTELSPRERLRPGLLLWGLRCIELGREHRVLFFSDESGGSWRPVDLPPPPGAEPGFRPDIRGVSNDPRYVIQYPSDTDCGRAVYWAWTGARFEVVRVDHLTKCKGVLEIQQWPVFTAEVIDPGEAKR